MSTTYTLTFNPVHILRRSGVSLDSVLDYIAVGRYQVLHTDADKYRDFLNGDKLRAEMQKDAMRIVQYFNQLMPKLSDAQVLAVYDYVVAIQHGPKSPRFAKYATKLHSVLFG